MNLKSKFKWKKSKILLVFSLISALISVQSLQLVANASQGETAPDFTNPTVIAGDNDSLYQAVQNASDEDVIGINGTIEVNAGIGTLGNSDKTIYLVRMNEGSCLKIKGQTELINLIIDGQSLNSSLPMLYIDNEAACYLSSCTIQNCINQDNGGAIYSKGYINTNNSILRNNQAKNGGHIYIAAGSGMIYQSEVYNGSASESGGAIYNASFCTLNILKSKIHSSTADIIAGGICNYGTLKIPTGIVYGNSAPNASDISNSQYSDFEIAGLNELMDDYQAAGITPTEWVSDISSDITWEISKNYDLTNENAMLKLLYQTIDDSGDTGDNDNPTNPDEGNNGENDNTGDGDNSGDNSNTGNDDKDSGDDNNTGDSDNSGNGGNTDDSGNSGNDDNTNDNGDSDNTGNTDDSGNSGDGDNTDDSGDTGDSNASDNPDSGNSGDNNNSDTGDNANTEDSDNSGNTGNTGDNGNQDTGDKPDTDDSGNSDNSGNTDDNKKDDADNQGNSSDTGDKNNTEISNSNNTTNTQGDTSTTSTTNNNTTNDDRSDNSKSDSHNTTTNNTTNNYYDRSATDGNSNTSSSNKRTSDSNNGSPTVNSTTNYYSAANPSTTNAQESSVSGNSTNKQNMQLPDNLKLNLTNVDIVYEMIDGRSNIEISTTKTDDTEQTSTQTVFQEQVPATTALASTSVSTVGEVRQSSDINWYEIVKIILLGAIIILVIPKKRKVTVNNEV